MLSPELHQRLEAAYQIALERLLAERTAEGYWSGELSASALSTATAVSALALVQKARGHREFDPLIDRGVEWLATHQNDDGGWGDTVKSVTNISTTMLGRAAFRLTGRTGQFSEAVGKADKFVDDRCGSAPEAQAEAIRKRYGRDRTFAVPILTTCALAGMVSWKEVPALPFELACLPQKWFRCMRLHVVSYALPALIAIGQCVYYHKKPWNPFKLLIRKLAIRRSLRVLERIQPSNGGFLEATPLTSFVTLSLASIGRAEHPAAVKGAAFLVKSVRADGSWPIDTNLATWVTTLAINALATAGELPTLVQQRGLELVKWLLDQQFREPHPYTGADPWGWAWTPLPGGVPDADDTCGAFLALRHLDQLCHADISAGIHSAIINGLPWLLNLQNRDGGWPTFCRGWGKLPFDRSGADLTAHALRAIRYWSRVERDPGNPRRTQLIFRFRARDMWQQVADVTITGGRAEPAIHYGLEYLRKHQQPDGSWLPLWFGNQHAPDDVNPTYGTARVLAAYRDLSMMDTEPARRGVRWLLDNQNADGGWGGMKGTPSSIEETALAVEVLLDCSPLAPREDSGKAVNSGLTWLVEQVESGGLDNATPIGFYFAKLWYSEKLYPMIFSVAALGRCRRSLLPPTVG